MGDEELNPQQKLAIAANFVLNSPPCQTTNVMDGAQPPCRWANTRFVLFSWHDILMASLAWRRSEPLASLHRRLAFF